MARIVVGIDGSEASSEALRFALGEARLRQTTLEVVHAWVLPHIALSAAGYVPQVDSVLLGEMKQAAEQLLDSALAAVEEETEDVRIVRSVVEGTPAKALVRAAADADLLVVGSRGLGGFAGLLLGSVSQQCAHHAPCPVVIVPAKDALST